MSEDSDFDGEWKEEVETKVSVCSSMLCEDECLDGELCKGEIEKCVCNKTHFNKTGGSNGLVGELVKYGGGGMVDLLHQLFKVVWHEETVPKRWREGLIVKKGVLHC